MSRRERVDETREKKAHLGEGPPIWADQFTEEEIKSEPRRTKHKVALIFGYAGTGYHGSQIERTRKTIEGDLWRACVRGGMVSKANSDDPKKVAWVRCSRTDRNVHAAANVVSGMLIDEDEDIVQRVNQHLPGQIRLWGVERLNKSFNAHQRCQARIYQYWIPTFCFIPPHPKSYLGTRLRELAMEFDNGVGYNERQKEVADFWEKADAEYTEPLLREFDPEIVAAANKVIFESGLQNFKYNKANAASNKPAEEGKGEDIAEDKAVGEETAEKKVVGEERAGQKAAGDDAAIESISPDTAPPPEAQPTIPANDNGTTTGSPQPIETELERALRAIKEAHKSARRSYRISPERLERVRASLAQFNGTHNFWNFTEQKRHEDPSAKRYMQACTAEESPIVVDGTEWLPLKLQGQSFMIHQIRKMVTMVAMTVRCGSLPEKIQEAFESTRLNIPKAPPTGLLLERPLFDAFNKSLERLQSNENRGQIDFDKFQNEIEAFKHKYIVEPMHAIEQRDRGYQSFFGALDSLRSTVLLYLSSKGRDAVDFDEGKGDTAEQVLGGVLPEDEDDNGD